MSHKSSLSKRTGNYGKRKYLAFRILSSVAEIRGRDGYLSTKELAIYSGVPYRSLTRALPKWVEWGYVERRQVQFHNKRRLGEFEYRLLIHGKSWLDLADKKLHTRHKFYDELRRWYLFGVFNKSLLVACPFNKLVDILDVVRTKIPAVAWSSVRIRFDKKTKQYNIAYDDSLAS